jgi:hypothetical protein
MQHRAPCPDDPADLSTAWASKLHGIPLSAPHCRFLRLFVVSDNSAQRENVPKATLARRSGFALIASSLPQSGRHVAVLAGQAAAASAFRDETTMPAPRGHFFAGCASHALPKCGSGKHFQPYELVFVGGFAAIPPFSYRGYGRSHRDDVKGVRPATLQAVAAKARRCGDYEPSASRRSSLIGMHTGAVGRD